MSKSGAYPVNPASPVGKVRLNVGDANATVPAGGAPEYKYFSDAEIQTFLAQSNGDVIRASGFAFLQLAAILVALGKSIKTDDEALDIRQRGKDMLEVAASYFAQADMAAAAENDGFFDVVTPYCVPEVGF